MGNRNKLHCKLFSVCQGISNVRFWHEADILIESKVRYERGAGIGNL